MEEGGSSIECISGVRVLLWLGYWWASNGKICLDRIVMNIVVIDSFVKFVGGGMTIIVRGSQYGRKAFGLLVHGINSSTVTNNNSNSFYNYR